MKPLEAIRCTHPACPCECFAPGKQSLRYCDSCSHGWVAHALDKLGTNHVMNLGLQVEVVQPNIVFDIASLMLYGAHATPVRLKILLDRLFSVLQHEEVLQVLHGFGWTYEDYARGYILQDSSGRVLDKWCVATREEEMVVLQQFLRFGETKAIAQEIILQDTKDRHEVLVKQTSRAESDIKKFIERSNLSMQNYIKSYESTRQLFGTRAVPFIPPGNRMITSPLISPTYSPSRDARTVTLPQTPTTSTTPLAAPPLNRLQVMQPFDARKEQASPAISLSPGSLDKSAARRSPLCDSPKNLSTTPTVVSSVTTSPSHQVLQPQQHQPQGLDEVDGGDQYASGSEEDGEVLDYSNKDNPDSPSDGEKKNKQHMRKSTNPIKRQWTPSANFGSTFVGPNGKKRVLCTACNKTFCDKGALKIHYSAVHLKEMHKCTVEGCNMMFSSRRSRNRHSANPNPKLHMPQKRKDEHDVSEELDLSSSNGSVTPVASSTPTMSITNPTNAQAIPKQVLPILDTPRIIRPDSSFFIEMSAQFPFLPPPEKRVKLDEELPTDLSKISSANSSEEEPCDLTKKYDGEMKLEIDLDAVADDKEDKRDEEVEADETSLKNEGGMRGGNRRKNAAPTRCAQQGESRMASDDNSDDKDPTGKPSPGHGSNTAIACNGESTPDTGKVNITSLEKVDGTQRSNSIEQTSPDETSKTEQQDTEAGSQSSPEKKQDGNGAKNFPKIASLLWAGGVNVEPAGVAEDVAIAEVSCDAESAKDEESNQGEEEEAEEDDASGSEESELLPTSEVMPDYPSDVYVDKDHPLQCKICGKVFQNSFTVKIHFQNVHLKLMHTCTVDGCTATFPSKRSRDRHSANLNLHRRILTGDSNTEAGMDDALRGDILAKLYGHDLVGASNASKATPKQTVDGDNESKPEGNNNNNNNNDEPKVEPEGQVIQLTNDGKVAAVPASSPLKITIQHNFNGHPSKPGSTGSEAVSDDSEGEAETVDKDEYIDSNTHKVPCKLCGEKFSNPLVLQEHISITHPEHALSPPDPATRKSVSPRRARSRPKPRNGMTTRKSTSL